MDDQCDAHWMGINRRRQTARRGPSWLVIAAVRPGVLPIFESWGAVRDADEPDWYGSFGRLSRAWLERDSH
jgi:hypothetical protein